MNQKARLFVGIPCLIIFLFSLTACADSNEKNNTTSLLSDDASTPLINYRVVKDFPHDTTAYTEGFLVHNGLLFEATGHTNTFPNTRSLFGIINLTNGIIDKKVEIDKNKYFGEGISFLNNKIYQLTDTTRIGFVYDQKTYKKLGSFHYNGEGWGLTTNGKDLLMTNGSSNIYYRDPATFSIIKTLGVRDNNGPVQNLNELELIRGYLYANQWQTDYILKIDTTTGMVLGKLDLTKLKTEVRQKYRLSQETNGIAYDSVADKIYVTGKMWPTIYEIQFDH